MESRMRIEEVARCLDKFKLYKEQEQLLHEDFNGIMSKLKYTYKTNNSKKIDDLNITLANKLDIISDIHENNETVIEKNIENYINTEKSVNKIFENIEIR